MPILACAEYSSCVNGLSYLMNPDTAALVEVRYYIFNHLTYTMPVGFPSVRAIHACLQRSRVHQHISYANHYHSAVFLRSGINSIYVDDSATDRQAQSL